MTAGQQCVRLGAADSVGWRRTALHSSPRPAGACACAYAFAESSPFCCSGHVLLIEFEARGVRVSLCWQRGPAETPAGGVRDSSLVRPVATVGPAAAQARLGGATARWWC